MDTGRVLFAARLAVAVVIAVGLSLAWAWDEPKWAMFAVIYCTLESEGESFHKGLMRILATFMGGALSLVFMALFNEQRWAFSGAIACWIFLCSYMMQDNRRYYFWFVGGWLTILMPIYSSENSAMAFEIVMLRLQETILGVLVYTFVANVLFIDRQRSDFFHELRDQIDRLKQTLTHLGVAYRGDTGVTGDDTGRVDLHRQVQALHTGFHNRIDAGIIDSFELVDRRAAWLRAIDEFVAFIDALDKFSIDIRAFCDGPSSIPRPDIRPMLAEVQRRLTQAAMLLDNATEVEPPQKIDLPGIDPMNVTGDLLDYGAVLISLDVLTDIDRHSAKLLLALAAAQGVPIEDIKDGSQHRDAETKPASINVTIPDPEKLALSLRTTMVFCLAFWIYIFVPDFPGGDSVVLLPTIIAMFMSMKPTTPTGLIQIMGTLVLVIAGILHMVVMPKLSSYVGLSAVLLVYMFIGAYLFSKPAYAPLRFQALGFVAMILQITNQQVYSFYYVANTLIVYQMPYILLWITRSWPVSFWPEAAFQRLLRRYMASFRYLVEDLRRDPVPPEPGWWKRQLHAYHLRNLLRTPDRIAAWVDAMSASAMSADEKKYGQALRLSLYELSIQMRDLSRLRREVSYSNDAFCHLHPTIRAWRDALEKLAEHFRDSPAALPAASDSTMQLNELLAQLRITLRETLEGGVEAPDSSTGGALLRELSAYRRLSETLIGASLQATALNWGRIRETRF